MKLTICSIIAMIITIILYCLQNKEQITDLSRFSRKNKYDMLILLLPWIFLEGFRTVTLYSDALSYWNDYLYNQFTIDFALQASKDGGWYIFQMILQNISGNPRFFMVFMATFYALAFATFISRVSDKRLIIVMLYVFFNAWVFQFMAMRQCTAIAICLFTVKYMENRKPIRFFLIVAIACTVHATAIVFIPIYFVTYLKNTKRDRIIMLVSAIIVCILSTEIYTWVMNNIADYEHYAIDYSDEGGVIFALIAMVILVFSEINRKELLTERPNLLPFYYLNYVFVCFCLLRVQYPMLERLKFYYISFMIVIFAENLSFYAKKRNYGQLVEVSALFLCFVYFLYSSRNYMYQLSF